MRKGLRPAAIEMNQDKWSESQLLKWHIIFWKQRECTTHLRREGANAAHDTVRIDATINDNRAMMGEFNFE